MLCKLQWTGSAKLARYTLFAHELLMEMLKPSDFIIAE